MLHGFLLLWGESNSHVPVSATAAVGMRSNWGYFLMFLYTWEKILISWISLNMQRTEKYLIAVTFCRNINFKVFCETTHFHRVSVIIYSLPALCDHRAVCSGWDGGVCYPLPHPPAKEASSVVVDLTSGPQDQRVPPVWTQRSACSLNILQSYLFMIYPVNWWSHMSRSCCS